MAELPTAEDFVGSGVTESGFKEAQTKLLEFVGALDGKISANGAGHYGVDTYATAETIKSALPAGTIIEVGNDPDPEKNGPYNWNGTILTKSQYDPKSQAINVSKAYVDEKVILEDSNNLLVLKDSNGKKSLLLNTKGELFIIGLEGDVAKVINSITSIITSKESQSIFEVKDTNGKTTLKQTLNGDLFAPKVGNLTEAILALQQNPSTSTSTEINLPAAHIAGKYADYTLIENMSDLEQTGTLLSAAYIDSLGLFPHPVTQIRIPAITRISKTKYLLFFEARQNGSDFGMNSQGVATIDINLETNLPTVSNIQVLHAAFVDGDGKLRTFMNACAVKLESGRIICLYVQRYGTTEHQLYKRISDDNGLTWSEYEDITSVKGSTGWNLLCPCSQGLVKRYGRYKGRIVFPLWTSGTAYVTNDFRAGYIYSDDNGSAWHLGEFAEYMTANEVQCAEDLNGDLLFAIRLENRSPPKVLTRLLDKTTEYKHVDLTQTLTNEIIMSGLIQGENVYDNSAAKFQLTACKNQNRTELWIHTSYDGGYNWQTHLLPSTIGQAVAYSCIENITASKKFLLWEGASSASLKYSIVALKNLISK